MRSKKKYKFDPKRWEKTLKKFEEDMKAGFDMSRELQGLERQLKKFQEWVNDEIDTLLNIVGFMLEVVDEQKKKGK